MSEAPDKRVWLFFGPLIILAILTFAVPFGAFAQHLLETVLYISCTWAAILIGAFSIRDGYSWCHPSSTREEWPVLFWLDVTVGCFLFAGIGIWKIFGMLKTFP